MMRTALVVFVVLVVASGARCCQLAPPPHVALAPQSPGDNHFRIIVSGDKERYVPGERYVVTVVGSRTHDSLQQFTRFKLVTEPLDPAAPRGPQHQGQFQLFADTLSQFDDACINTVIEADDLPKTEVQVMWKAPPAGSGCVLIKAMVMEGPSVWFAEDGQLTRRICEDVRRDSDCCACDDAKYKMVFEGLWSARTHPKDFPKADYLLHFSDVVGATHGKSFSFWGEGKIASDGFRSLAEWGSVDLMQRELQQSGRKLRSIVKASGLFYPKVNSNTTASFTVDRKRHLLSIASMFGPSPDWVVGVSGLDLCRKDCTWEPTKVVDLLPYDAGTDNGISYMSPNSETVPRERMYRITPMYPEDPRAPFYAPGTEEVPPLARLYLVREELVPRGCDEQLLQQLVAEVAENTETTDRPECATSEWSAWSACSVSCGKGLRMRTRAYRMPQKAAMFKCDRQLVSKEMCVAGIAECEQTAGAVEPTTPEDGGANESEPVCATSAWGPWSECSVTCGIGVDTRRRTFLHPMGLKKCPLVDVVEERKCMRPACTEPERDISDPTCPTTPWSSWSPCSASCGGGVRARMRLLLVPPRRQEECSAKVELMQQQPCSERASCDQVDMPTIKQMCMLDADPGPCRARGLHLRWAFNAQKAMCVPFRYNGCLGNRNNFLTRDECSAACKLVAEALTGGSAASAAAPGVQDNSLSSPGAFARQSEDVAEGDSDDCAVSEWSAWSPCSVSCGVGFQERTRAVLRAARAGGAECPTRLKMRRRCRRTC